MTKQQKPNAPKRPDFNAYTVRERDGKTANWTDIGAAWFHEDGQGLTINLEALPLDGKITLRRPKAPAEAAA